MAAVPAQMVRWGNSLAIRIPKSVAEAARLREGDRLLLEAESPGKLAVQAVQRPSLNQLLARITDANLHAEQDWGEPRGKELW